MRWGKLPLNFVESLYIALSGFGNGVSTAAVFVYLNAGTKKEDAAIVSGAFYLAISLGEVTGIAVQNCILIGSVRRILQAKLQEIEGCDEVSRLWFFVFLFSSAPREIFLLAQEARERSL